MPTIAITVRGRVQGVRFRAFVLREATALGLAGEVWNASSGDVEMLAVHASNDVLSTFVDRLRLGPGHVQTVSWKDIDAGGLSQGFRISQTR